MRMQILELPGVSIGEAYETPFVIILDSVGGEDVKTLDGATLRRVTRLDPVALEKLKAATGAKAVFVSDEHVEIVRN